MVCPSGEAADGFWVGYSVEGMGSDLERPFEVDTGCLRQDQALRGRQPLRPVSC